MELYLAYLARQLELFVHDFGVHHRTVVVEEGRLAREHLVQQRAEAPPIHFLAISLSLEQLRRCIQWST